MLDKLNDKTKKLREKDQVVSDLVNLTEKFKTQLNISDDLLKLTSNKMYSDVMNASLSKSNGGASMPKK